MLGLLASVAYYSEMYGIFSKYKKDLINNVLFTLIRTTQEELAVMTDNPKEFVHLSKDVADQQMSLTVKTQTSKLLELLTDHIDGCMSYIV